MAVTEGTPTAAPQRARVAWQTIIDHAGVTTDPLALHDGVLVAIDQDETSELRRYGPDGDIRWTLPLQGRAAFGPHRSGKLVATPLIDGGIVVCHLDTGGLLTPGWGKLTPARGPLVALGGNILVRHLAKDGERPVLTALSPDHAGPQWTIIDPCGSADAVCFGMTAGILLMAGTTAEGDATIVAVEPEDGEVRWRQVHRGARVHDLWAIGGTLDVVMSSGLMGHNPKTGDVRNHRFSGFPLDGAQAVGEHVVAIMDGNTGPMLLCFDAVSQRLIGRLTRALNRVVATHLNEVLVILGDDTPALFTIPELEPVALPEAAALGTPTRACFSHDTVYVVSDDGRALSAIELET